MNTLALLLRWHLRFAVVLPEIDSRDNILVVLIFVRKQDLQVKKVSKVLHIALLGITRDLPRAYCCEAF